jgi:cytidylate kinase
MKNYVITIARENGSNGRAIGEALAGRLGIPFYNRDILRMAADDSGINEQLFANAEKSFRSSLLFRVAKDAYNGEVIPPDSDNFVSNENLFRYQAKVMLGLAQNESCVMIGRCADFILRDRPNVLRVFIHAPEEVRVRRVMQRHNLSEAEATCARWTNAARTITALSRAATGATPAIMTSASIPTIWVRRRSSASLWDI